jgi:hypothetical protein
MSQPETKSATHHLEVDLTAQEMDALFEHLAEWSSPANLILKRKLRAAITAAGGPRLIPADEVMAHALEHARGVITRITAPASPTSEIDAPSAIL